MKQPLPPYQPPPPTIYEEEKELTLRDIVLIIKDYIREIKNHWKLIPLCILPIAAILLFLAIFSQPQYKSDVTFLVTKDNDKSFGEIGSLLGNLGVKGGAEEESALEKVLQLFRSRQIIQTTLFQNATVKGKVDYLSNHFIQEYGWLALINEYKSFGFLSPNWVREMEELRGFEFKHAKIDSFNRTENLAMKVLYERIVGNENAGIDPIVSSGIDEKSGIMRIGLQTISEDLTAETLLLMYDQLSQYYINKTIEKQLKIYEIAEFKRDSLNLELKVADRKLAEFEDGNRNLVWVRGELERTKLQRKARILETLYASAIQQLELSDFALRQKTPYVQIIDPPARPILPEQKSKIMAIAIAILVGSFIAVFFICGRKALRDLMKETDERPTTA